MLHAADETTQPAQVAQAAVAMTEGEVGKIDRDALKVGDKIRFVVERVNGTNLMTRIKTKAK